MHAARYRALEAAVVGMAEGQHATLTSLGRSLASRTSPRHGIKRIDRLLGNAKLFRERSTIFGALSRQLIGGVARVPVLVDWTALSDARLYALVATVSFRGRSVPILARVLRRRSLARWLLTTNFWTPYSRLSRQGASRSSSPTAGSVRRSLRLPRAWDRFHRASSLGCFGRRLRPLATTTSSLQRDLREGHDQGPVLGRGSSFCQLDARYDVAPRTWTEPCESRPADTVRERLRAASCV